MRIATRLLDAAEAVSLIPTITSADPGFGLQAAYRVWESIAAVRRAAGWQCVGRKIGFTNRSIWARYGVERPMWAHIWNRTVTCVGPDPVSLSLAPFARPRIEPEVVFKLSGPVPITDHPTTILRSVEWMAAGFEIVHCHFPDWQFTLADCTADFGLHGALLIGEPVIVNANGRQAVADRLSTFTATLSHDGVMVDQGVGANVLDSPALALGHLAQVIAGDGPSSELSAGDIVTTGTITDAWPIRRQQTWASDYGDLGLSGLTLSFT